jgi:GNAT superfamily N-acetyltransferase
MTVSIVRDAPARLIEYAHVSIGFAVDTVFDEPAVTALLRGDIAIPTTLDVPYWKDYDSYPGNRPTDWPHRFDVSRWIVLAAFADRDRVGGAVVIHDDSAIELLADCRACALLWDLRVAPTMRGRGIGSALLRSVEDVTARLGARSVRVETQQINVPACRFYAGHGFRLERAVREAYGDLPGETQLLWGKMLDAKRVLPFG